MNKQKQMKNKKELPIFFSTRLLFSGEVLESATWYQIYSKSFIQVKQ